MYNEKVMDHFANPRNVGEIPDADGVGTVGNAVCGDIMQMYIKVKTILLRISNLKLLAVALPLPQVAWLLKWSRVNLSMRR